MLTCERLLTDCSASGDASLLTFTSRFNDQVVSPARSAAVRKPPMLGIWGCLTPHIHQQVQRSGGVPGPLRRGEKTAQAQGRDLAPVQMVAQQEAG